MDACDTCNPTYEWMCSGSEEGIFDYSSGDTYELLPHSYLSGNENNFIADFPYTTSGQSCEASNCL